jgi:hypothetical protein
MNTTPFDFGSSARVLPTGTWWMRPLTELSVAGALVLLGGCSSADPGGCKKDTDCAVGRICGSDGRCEDESSEGGSNSGGGSGSSSGTSGTSVPTINGEACTTYLVNEEACGSTCGCGATCIYPASPILPFCGIECTDDQECKNVWAQLGGGTPREAYCHIGTANWCIYVN